MRFLKSLLTHFLVGICALIFLIEETLWEALTRLTARLGRLPIIRDIEARIRRLGPLAALSLFLIPMICLLPVKLSAVWLMAHHHAALGIGIIILAKIAGTAVGARLYSLCQPALMSWPWFAAVRDWILVTKARIYAKLEALPAWRAVRTTIRRWRASASARVHVLIQWFTLATGQRGSAGFVEKLNRRWRAARRLVKRGTR